MSNGVPEIIRWDQAYNRNGKKDLPRAVVNVIRTYMNNHTLSGWVKAETLAEATGMSVRGVRKQIAANVEAGWLQIAEPGNSSKASVYRLTYPDREPQFTVPTVERVNHSSPFGGEGCTTVHGKGEPQFTPTTPRTSPKEKFSTSPRTVNSSSPFGEPEITNPESADVFSLPSGLPTAVEVDNPTEDDEGFRPSGLCAPLASTASTEKGSPCSDPFSEESLKQRESLGAEAAAREARAVRMLESSAATVRAAAAWAD